MFLVVKLPSHNGVLLRDLLFVKVTNIFIVMEHYLSYFDSSILENVDFK